MFRRLLGELRPFPLQQFCSRGPHLHHTNTCASINPICEHVFEDDTMTDSDNGAFTDNSHELINPTFRTDEEFYVAAEKVIRSGQTLVQRATDYAMVYSYYELGRMIVEREQGGSKRAGYGKRVLEGLSGHLTKVFDKGYSVVELTLP